MFTVWLQKLEGSERNLHLYNESPALLAAFLIKAGRGLASGLGEHLWFEKWDSVLKRAESAPPRMFL